MIEQLKDFPDNFFRASVVTVVYVADAWRVKFAHAGGKMTDEQVSWWVTNMPKANYLTYLGTSGGASSHLPLVYSGIDIMCLQKTEAKIVQLHVLVPLDHEDLDVILITFQMNGVTIPWDDIDAKEYAGRQGQGSSQEAAAQA